MHGKYMTFVKKYFKNRKVRNKFLEQINFFYEINNFSYANHSYKIGDEILLKPNYLIHGSRISIDDIYKIKENGLLSVEFCDKRYPNQKKPYTCEFWYIKNNIYLKDYINKYTGGTLIFKRNDQNIEIISNIDNLSYEIKNMNEEYVSWEIYQTKEARFLPTNSNISLAFILNCNNEAIHLLDNSIQSNNLDESIKKSILPKWFYNKYVKNGFHNYDVFETDREIAVLFGMPSSLIEGVIINDKYINDKEVLNNIKSLFPNVYICNCEGKVIY